MIIELMVVEVMLPGYSYPIVERHWLRMVKQEITEPNENAEQSATFMYYLFCINFMKASLKFYVFRVFTENAAAQLGGVYGLSLKNMKNKAQITDISIASTIKNVMTELGYELYDKNHPAAEAPKAADRKFINAQTIIILGTISL